MKKTYIIIISILTILYSCEKEGIEVNKPTTNPISEIDTIVWNNNGLGLNFGYPSGEQFYLPEKVFLHENKISISPFSLPYENWSFKQSGSDATFSLFMFIYCEAENVTLKIPGGLIFYTTQDSTQNGFIMKDVFIPLENFNFIMLEVFCLNKTRTILSNSPFSFGPITSHPELKKISNILNEKEDIFNPYAIGIIQSMIWKITEENGKLSQENIDYLENLP